jgi:hypothetical protein
MGTKKPLGGGAFLRSYPWLDFLWQIPHSRIVTPALLVTFVTVSGYFFFIQPHKIIPFIAVIA